MSRVEPQLREYFDAGVERISVEDVVAQARVRENRLEPLRARRNLKPAWAAVGAFAVTILGIGGLAAALKLTERITGEFGSDVAAIVATDSGTLGVWLIAAFVAALAAAAATWLIRRPAQYDTQDQQDQGKVMVMETIEGTDRDVGTTKETTKPNRRPTVLVVVLAVALLGLIAWMIFAMRPNSPTAAPPEIVELMEQYNAAWNAHDVDAIEAVTMTGYRIHGRGGGSIDADIVGLRLQMPSLAAANWSVASDGPYYALESASRTWYVSSEGSVISRAGDEHNHQGLLEVVEVPDGSLRILDHYIMGG
jgi:hypothetical protein